MKLLFMWIKTSEYWQFYMGHSIKKKKKPALVFLLLYTRLSKIKNKNKNKLSQNLAA